MSNNTGIIKMPYFGSENYYNGSSFGSADKTFYDSIEHRMYRHHKEKYENENRKVSFENVVRDAINTLHGGLYLIDNDLGIKLNMKVSCDFKSHANEDIYPDLDKFLKDRYPWVSSDPNTIPYLMAFTKRSDFIPRKEIIKSITYLFQMGFSDIFRQEIFKHDHIKNIIPNLKNKDNEIRECLFYSKTLKVPSIGHQSVKIENLFKFGGSFFICLFISFIIFVSEVFKDWIKPRTRVKKLREKRKQTWYLIRINHVQLL